MQDEEKRKKIFLIISIPIAIILIVITSIHSIFSMGEDELLTYFNEEDLPFVYDVLDEFAYEYNYLSDDFDMDSLGEFEAINKDVYEKLMAEATKHIGRPYKWGGSTPKTSFDCSGFICWSYTKSGAYNLPRTTAQGIYSQCQKISSNQAKAGDLIFFTGTYKTVNPVTHIGIYVGNNQMLHCGNPIGFANINSAYWQKHYYGFGRLLTSDEEVFVTANK